MHLLPKVAIKPAPVAGTTSTNLQIRFTIFRTGRSETYTALFRLRDEVTPQILHFNNILGILHRSENHKLGLMLSFPVAAVVVVVVMVLFQLFDPTKCFIQERREISQLPTYLSYLQASPSPEASLALAAHYTKK